MPIDDVDDSKVVENVQVFLKTVSIIEDIAVGFDTLIIDETHMSSDSASNNVNVKVEPNTTTVPSKPVESSRAEYSFMIVPTVLGMSYLSFSHRELCLEYLLHCICPLHILMISDGDMASARLGRFDRVYQRRRRRAASIWI